MRNVLEKPWWGLRISVSALLFLFFFSIYAFTMSGWSQYGDEVEKYRVAQSIVDRQDLAIRPTEMFQIRGVDRRTYSTYELGQSVIEVPLYALGRAIYFFFPQPDLNWIGFLFVGLLNPLLTALTCVTLFKVCQELGFRDRTALALSLVFGLGTIAWVYSKGFTREPLLGLLILLTFYAAYRFSKTNQTRWLLFAGVLAGYLVFTKFLQVIVIPFFLVYVAVTTFQSSRKANSSPTSSAWAALRSSARFVLPMVAFLIVQGFYAWLRFGTLGLGVIGVRFDLLAALALFVDKSDPVATMVRLLFSPEKSVFIYSPLILLFLVTWIEWFKNQAKEATLALGLILSALFIAILRFDGDGGSWWGPRYLVQLTPLLLIPLGVLESPRFSRRFWTRLFGLLFLLGLFVQIIGVFGNDRDYLNTTGNYSSLAGQIDFLRHGALDSLVLYLSPGAPGFQINPFGILLIAIAGWLGVWLVQRLRGNDKAQPSAKASWGFLATVLAIQFVAFIVWIVAPYPNILAGKGNTRFVAGENFLADGRTCEAAGMYVAALEWQTTLQPQTIARVNQLMPRAPGKIIPIEDAMRWIDVTGNAKIESDPVVAIDDMPSTRFSAGLNQDVSAIITSSPIPAQANTTYELSGWLKSSSIYGAGYGVVTVFEDDGDWGNGRSTDIQNMDESHGWQPFRDTITTLATTQRLFVKAGLYKTNGTLWVDGIQLVQVDPSAPRSSGNMPPCN